MATQTSCTIATQTSPSLEQRSINLPRKKKSSTNKKSAAIISNAFEDAIIGNIKSGLSLENEIQRFHKRLANNTTKNMIQYYQDGKKGNDSYRNLDKEKWRKRYPNKKMEKGLRTVIRTTKTGIVFDFDELSIYAKQWTRLNFGTEPAGSPKVRTSKLSIFGRKVSQSPSFEQFGSLRAFTLPDGGGKAFALPSSIAFRKTPSLKKLRDAGIGPGAYWYVYGSKYGSKKEVTKGIRGWRFIDKAINEMNKEWNTGIKGIVNDWVERVEKDFRRQAEVRQNIVVPEQPRITRVNRFPTRSIQAGSQRRDPRTGRFIRGFNTPTKGYWIFE
jgi:hypothetical protein